VYLQNYKIKQTLNMGLKIIFFIPKIITLWLILGTAWSLEADTIEKRPIKAIAFDAFPIFDPRPIEALALELFPAKGRELTRLWRSRQFEYQWLRALGGNYKNFIETTEDALVFTARQLDIPLTDDARKKLMSSYSNLSAWPDAKEAIIKLKANGYKIVFLSNMTEEMLRSGLATSGLEDLFDDVYSTDSKKTYKPSPHAYQIALDKLSLSREEILFVAFAGWDAAGAKWFGYPTFWVNRSGSDREELGNAPDGAGRNLQSLVDFLNSDSKAKENSAK
jgi:2-haloacid dehalogenase